MMISKLKEKIINVKEKDSYIFFTQLLKNPRQVGAVLPSGSHLTRKITSCINPNDGPVIEIGAGTGTFTKAILETGINPQQFVAIENCDNFVKRLEKGLPQANILHMDAGRLNAQPPFGHGQTKTVISGIPFLSIGTRKTFQILKGVFYNLSDDGAMFLFSYSPKKPIPTAILDKIGFNCQLIIKVPLNVPSAYIFKVTKKI